MKNKTVVLIAEAEKAVNPSAAMDLAALGSRMAQSEPAEVRWLVVGGQAAQAGEHLAEKSGYPVTALVTPPGKLLTGELLGDVLRPILTDLAGHRRVPSHIPRTGLCGVIGHCVRRRLCHRCSGYRYQGRPPYLSARRIRWQVAGRNPNRQISNCHDRAPGFL